MNDDPSQLTLADREPGSARRYEVGEILTFTNLSNVVISGPWRIVNVVELDPGAQVRMVRALDA